MSVCVDMDTIVAFDSPYDCGTCFSVYVCVCVCVYVYVCVCVCGDCISVLFQCTHSTHACIHTCTHTRARIHVRAGVFAQLATEFASAHDARKKTNKAPKRRRPADRYLAHASTRTRTCIYVWAHTHSCCALLGRGSGRSTHRTCISCARTTPADSQRRIYTCICRTYTHVHAYSARAACAPHAHHAHIHPPTPNDAQTTHMCMYTRAHTYTHTALTRRVHHLWQRRFARNGCRALRLRTPVIACASRYAHTHYIYTLLTSHNNEVYW